LNISTFAMKRSGRRVAKDTKKGSRRLLWLGARIGALLRDVLCAADLHAEPAAQQRRERDPDRPVQRPQHAMFPRPFVRATERASRRGRWRSSLIVRILLRRPKRRRKVRTCPRRTAASSRWRPRPDENDGMARTPGSPTLGHDLERRRLEHRIRRVQRVVGALEDRATLRSSEGGIPPALTEAVRDFSSELSRLNRRLADLRDHRP